ncbi:cubilin-like [Haliotis cracherodii]|uniref:cubilin-like n=1 Tax=Haliotis cracherodii TaxID=6455 RepID=UPI0039EB3BE6
MTLTASKGEITSPGYPGNYNNNLDCTYVIVGGGQTQTINIDLVQLDLETNSGCSYDWLIIDGGPKMCSNTTFHKNYVFRHRFVIKFRSDGSNTRRGFQIQYYIDANDNCTAFNLKTSGQISTPCYACNCTYNNCTNTIIGSGKLQTLILDFVSLNFKTSSNCDLGWFNIDGGPRICTSTPFKTTYAFAGIIDIVTHGGDRSVDSCARFVANYVVEDTCSTTLTASEGEMTSPGYFGTDYNYVTCTYVIVGDGQNRSIAIDLVDLNVEEVSDCGYDWLIIDDGPKLCRSHTTFHKTYVFWDRFIIKFRSDYRSPGRGFKMHYSVGVDAHDSCTSIHLKTSGQISTPCHSCNCTYNNCTNTIIGNWKLQTLILYFVSLNFPISANCDLGWFTIDGGPKMCTSTPFKTTYAFFGSVDIVTSGGDRPGDSCAGFVVNYVVQDNCSTTLTAREGYITSPDYPGTPNNYLTCTYVVVGDGQNQSIAIDLVELDVQEGSDCGYDWLVIDDGPKLCRSRTTFHKTYVFRDRFIIKFRSDYRSTSRGFKIHYSVGVDAHDNCTSIHLKTSGQISTPCYSCNCTICNSTNTIIGSGKLQTLNLDFVSLNFTTSANCDLGWFTIDGGPRICTSTPFQRTYAFYGSVDIVTHGGNRSVDSCAGFVVNYVVEDNCSTTLTASEGEITSPDYPDIPTNYLTCAYVVLGDRQNQSITIDLVELDLKVASDCSNDWLIINDGPKLCYNTTFHKTYVFRDRFIIKFRIDGSSTRSGFKIRYATGKGAHDNCTSIHLKTSGQISTPCYSCNCTFCNSTNTIIGSGKMQTLTLDFVSLNFTTSSNCDLGWFTIDGGPKICTSNPFKTTYAFSDSVDIVTNGGDRSVDTCAGFVVNYVVEDSCLTTLTDSKGEITSPGYPGNYINNLNCTYVIVGDGQTESIIIDLVELDLETTTDCRYDWLVIDDGPKLCYPTSFHKTYVFRNRFVIKFGTDGSNTRRGFKIRYSFDSDAHDNCTFINLKTAGQISTPCYPCNCTYNNCINTIIGSGKLQTLTLDFVSLNFTTRPNCDLGWFTIDGGPRICTLIPFKKSYAFFSSVDIVTNGGNRSVDSCAGFVVNYDVEDNCSTTLTASKGEITSPGYPGIPYNYPTCTYVIVGGGQKQSIIIDLVDLDVQESSDCGEDWLVIDDGPKLCRSRTTFHKTYFFWNRFIIKFRTDYTSKTRGFKIRYSIGVDVNDNCTSTHLKTSGQISTPCYSCNCTYNNFTNTIIGSGKLQTLTLDFVSLNFTASHNCDLGWFTIDGGPRICTSNPFKRTYAFFGSVDIVTYGGDRFVDSAGFVVNYVVEDNCSTTFTASEGEITSPGYPGIPYNYLTCTYVVLGDGQNQSITIDLLQLDLTSGSDCPYDWLIIDDGPKLCYKTTFHKSYAFQDKFIIKFRSDYRSASDGFKMHYAVGVDAQDTCTSTHLTTSGQISTPCYSCNCTYNNCTNTVIGSGKLQTLTLDFVSLIFTTSTNCDLGWFTIDGGPKLCTSTPFKTTYAFLGSADIVTHGGGRSVDSCGGFVVDYVVEDVDNNKLTYTTNSGQLVGPLFPGASSSSRVTTTYIIVGHVPKQSLILDITLSSYYSGCSYAKLTLNGTEDLCDTGRYSRTYFSQNNFTIEFLYYYYNSSFLIHYEKEDITKGKPLL